VFLYSVQRGNLNCMCVWNNSKQNNPVDLDSKIMTVNRANLEHIKRYRSKLLSRNTKFKPYKTVIRPVLTYGSETWAVTTKEINALRIF
jgi:hypothetical protein